MLIQIPKYPDYQINESGTIIDNSGKLLRQSLTNEGRLYVYINNELVYIDEIVAETYIPNPNNYEFIQHIDNDFLNNHYTNLNWTNEEPKYFIKERKNREYSGSRYIYQVFNDDESDVINCLGRGEVAKLIQYEEISLKNMVGNGRKIALGPYKGYMIRRI